MQDQALASPHSCRGPEAKVGMNAPFAQAASEAISFHWATPNPSRAYVVFAAFSSRDLICAQRVRLAGFATKLCVSSRIPCCLEAHKALAGRPRNHVASNREIAVFHSVGLHLIRMKMGKFEDE